ncbi:MAG: MBL fold metallo-hydrolase [Patescibacteria group bacterium]
MNIRILGTRGEIPLSAPRHRNHSGMLVDDTILFDLGERKFLDYDPKAIFITHLHPDHAAFVRTQFMLPHVPIYAPETTYPFLRKAKKVSMAPYCITPIPTDHSRKVKSCAYLIERSGTRILYTGDLYWMRKNYRQKLGELDCIVTEGSFLKEGGMIRTDAAGERLGHAGIPNLIRLFKPYTKKIIFIHFGSWFFRNIRHSHTAISALGEKYGLSLVVAYDGMTLTI